jgi:hypothetical protein
VPQKTVMVGLDAPASLLDRSLAAPQQVVCAHWSAARQTPVPELSPRKRRSHGALLTLDGSLETSR